ncbi:hypothetical protein CALCODRAFT_514807 [Calocera cornea HHB12733]|uniref:Uncharacterized protein n=1 Tax=Calocera cornea HHB12733 TaxID=1353952 RepID=A0A165J272_9BASI|nr:hypothetical protein CALCODRAFT_514807 [Calocera cornea HHB12733]
MEPKKEDWRRLASAYIAAKGESWTPTPAPAFPAAHPGLARASPSAPPTSTATSSNPPSAMASSAPTSSPGPPPPARPPKEEERDFHSLLLAPNLALETRLARVERLLQSQSQLPALPTPAPTQTENARLRTLVGELAGRIDSLERATRSAHALPATPPPQQHDALSVQLAPFLDPLRADLDLLSAQLLSLTPSSPRPAPTAPLTQAQTEALIASSSRATCEHTLHLLADARQHGQRELDAAVNAVGANFTDRLERAVTGLAAALGQQIAGSSNALRTEVEELRQQLAALSSLSPLALSQPQQPHTFAQAQAQSPPSSPPPSGPSPSALSELRQALLEEMRELAHSAVLEGKSYTDSARIDFDSELDERVGELADRVGAVELAGRGVTGVVAREVKLAVDGARGEVERRVEKELQGMERKVEKELQVFGEALRGELGRELGEAMRGDLREGLRSELQATLRAALEQGGDPSPSAPLPQPEPAPEPAKAPGTLDPELQALKRELADTVERLRTEMRAVLDISRACILFLTARDPQAKEVMGRLLGKGRTEAGGGKDERDGGMALDP